jgi:histidyl-tRNA synthetase
MTDGQTLDLQPVRGMRDYAGVEGTHLLSLVNTFWQQAGLFGYTPCLTPILEGAGVFSRSLGETSDVISKEMYTLSDRGGDPLVLRPEGTAGIVRALLSNRLHQDMPARMAYVGPMFRYERPQKGRLRQFHQVGVEHFGDASPEADVESLLLSWQYLKAVGAAKDARLQINTLGDFESRAAFRTALVNYLTPLADALSADSQRRLQSNPLRILDSKDAGDHAVLENAPALQDFLTDNARAHFNCVCDGLTALGVPFTINPKIVRGLDYYVHTTFEWVHDGLGAQGTILAGGRYDGLVKTMGGPDLPGIGWAAGVERLMLATLAPSLPVVSVVVAPAEKNHAFYAQRLAQALRDAGFSAEVWFEGSLKKRLKKTSQRAIPHLIFIDEEELATETLSLKVMKTGGQHRLSLDQALVFLGSQEVL